MRTDEIVKIKDRVTMARAKLLVAVGGLDAVAWEWQPGDGRWSVRLTLAHVGSAQWSHLEVVRRLIAREPVAVPDFELDAWNLAQVAKRADWTVAQVLADLETAHQETLAFLDSLDDEKLDIVGSHPALGEISVGQVFRVIALHDSLHRRDIVQLLREMGKG
jgi:uncharacterized damage-inducible protein DinB